jgi:hypothetical protein
LNQVKPNITPDMNNFEDLLVYCEYPIFCCGYQQALPPIFEVIAQ